VLEKEIQSLLDVVPELEAFYGQWIKGPVLVPSQHGEVSASPTQGVAPTIPQGVGTGGDPVGPGYSRVEASGENEGRAKPISRVRKRGPRVAFAEDSSRDDMGWVSGDTIFVNSAHPCYLKTPAGSAQRRMYCMFAIASALQRHFCEPREERDLAFADRLMAAWARK
jgi:hypothetical protein